MERAPAARCVSHPARGSPGAQPGTWPIVATSLSCAPAAHRGSSPRCPGPGQRARYCAVSGCGAGRARSDVAERPPGRPVRIPSRQGELTGRSSSGDAPGGRGPSGTPHRSAPGRAERPPTPRGTPGGEPGAEISLGGLPHGSRDEETGRPRGRCPAADRTQAQEVDPRPRGRQVRLRGGVGGESVHCVRGPRRAYTPASGLDLTPGREPPGSATCSHCSTAPYVVVKGSRSRWVVHRKGGVQGHLRRSAAATKCWSR